MSEYYNAKRTRNLYDPKSTESFKLSRSKIDLFIECPRCFYIDRKLGTGRPPGYPFSLNSAVDKLLKKEFDIHRAKQSSHPIMTTYGVDAVPFEHEMMNEWRENFKGVQYLHEPTNLIITGAVDDVWINPKKELIVVDYKSTAKDGEITLEEKWKDGYKRQMEVYQWLLRRNGFTVSNTGYFVYANGSTENEAFDGKLEFNVTLLPYKGDNTWVESTIIEIHECLNTNEIPEASKDCDYCNYRKAICGLKKPKIDSTEKDHEEDHSGYLKYAVQNCLLALEELKKANAELHKKMSQHEPMNINQTGGLDRIIKDYLVIRVAGLFDEDSRTVSFFHKFKNNKNYIKIRENKIIEYLINMRNKSVAHKDKDFVFEFPNTGKILQSNLGKLLTGLLDLLK